MSPYCARIPDAIGYKHALCVINHRIRRSQLMYWVTPDTHGVDRLVSDASAKSTDKPLCSECQTELAETATLPLLPDASDVPANAANDTEFTAAGSAINENLERLIDLAESIERQVERIAEAVVTAQSSSSKGTKKKSTSKK